MSSVELESTILTSFALRRNSSATLHDVQIDPELRGGLQSCRLIAALTCTV